jgi:hypothetical protein
MSDDNAPMGFTKFVPGFDFLQNLAKGASQTVPQMPSLSNWVAPTLNVEELEKRIGELRAVHFWLDQNSKALSATIQALEVQKMTLATLKSMNFNMNEMAEALRLKTADAVAAMQKGSEAAMKKGSEAAANAGGAASGAAKTPRGKAAAQDGAAARPASNGVVDPLQWWTALTQQFQQIAADALKDATRTGTDTGRNMATTAAKDSSRSGAVEGEAKTTTAAKSTPAKKARKTPSRRRSAAEKS